MAGTIFEKSSTPLTLWFHAVLFFSNAKSGISSKQMQRELNVTYKCAYRILKQIREALKQDNDKLSGDVEMDEGFIGGRGNGGTYNKNYSEVMKDKAKVIAAVERGGKMKAQHVPDVSSMSIWQFLEDHIAQNAHLLTDSSNRYDLAVQAHGMKRTAVNHSKKQFVKGDAHVNSVEWFWSHVKKSLKGTFKSVSKEQLQSYLDVFVWHYNNRRNDRQRFEALLGILLPVKG
ncbi:MAG: IS1595 family transposase [Candidatus Kerfeldbacteria bacterium]|nr:IS1595 family transposase [Candidatus Kerfeldbacteria bacterium]